ncbi:MAG: type II toxin-antitoxin system Phd/YefM family antitoxin [Deltaproteobacteria bacterium]|nr:MAG: type II toxin-antitoxin system Phd/YefM family antitoxin [Deltaproteobacteria bacterium]
MSQIGVSEAKTHFSQLLDRVAKGEEITITRYGVPVAVLGPVGGPNRQKVVEAVKAMKEFRKGRRLDGLSIRELIEEGRR